MRTRNGAEHEAEYKNLAKTPWRVHPDPAECAQPTRWTSLTQALGHKKFTCTTHTSPGETLGSRLVLLRVTELGPMWEAGKNWQNSWPFLGYPGGLLASQLPVFLGEQSPCRGKYLCILGPQALLKPAQVRERPQLSEGGPWG